MLDLGPGSSFDGTIDTLENLNDGLVANLTFEEGGGRTCSDSSSLMMETFHLLGGIKWNFTHSASSAGISALPVYLTNYYLSVCHFPSFTFSLCCIFEVCIYSIRLLLLLYIPRLPTDFQLYFFFLRR
jgi:hypothetical protein